MSSPSLLQFAFRRALYVISVIAPAHTDTGERHEWRIENCPLPLHPLPPSAAAMYHFDDGLGLCCWTEDDVLELQALKWQQVMKCELQQYLWQFCLRELLLMGLTVLTRRGMDTLKVGFYHSARCGPTSSDLFARPSPDCGFASAGFIMRGPSYGIYTAWPFDIDPLICLGSRLYWNVLLITFDASLQLICFICPSEVLRSGSDRYVRVAKAFELSSDCLISKISTLHEELECW